VSDPELSSEPFEGMVQDMDRARPDAAEFFQSGGQGHRTAVLSDALARLRKAAPRYAERTDLELAELIVFGKIHSMNEQHSG
jgi:uncharacterized membrane protein